MSLPEYIFLAVSSLFVIVDPLATAPALLAITPTDGPEQRIRMARLACCVAAGLLLAFAFVGKWVFKFLLAAVAIQFMLNAARQLKPTWFSPAA